MRGKPLLRPGSAPVTRSSKDADDTISGSPHLEPQPRRRPPSAGVPSSSSRGGSGAPASACSSGSSSSAMLQADSTLRPSPADLYAAAMHDEAKAAAKTQQEELAAEAGGQVAARVTSLVMSRAVSRAQHPTTSTAACLYASSASPSSGLSAEGRRALAVAAMAEAERDEAQRQLLEANNQFLATLVFPADLLLWTSFGALVH